MRERFLAEPLAIIGMECRLPGAENLHAYWDLLSRGRSAIGELPERVLDRSRYFSAEKGVRGKSYTSIGGVVSHSRQAEHSISALLGDGEGVDECHRLFAETALLACRDANLFEDQLRGSQTGVFVGHSAGSPLGGDFALSALAGQFADVLNEVDACGSLSKRAREELVAGLTGKIRESRPRRDAQGEPNIEANRVAGFLSDKLELNGPSMAIDAACASGLVALWLAALSLEAGDCRQAIVGGASFNKADSLVLFSHARSCSANGSRPFDADADGLVSSEGYVALVVKKLSRAIADGDRVRAVIPGLGVSSDGRGRSLWAPRAEGQVEAIRRAYSDELPTDSIDYIEAHATSTRVGDATELRALDQVFEASPSGKTIPIGSVKSNIGHTLETAGLAGLVKVILAMEQRQIPPSINFQTPNPEFDWANSKFEVATESRSWEQQSERPRRAAVNAFGIGGLNVHVVVEAPAAVSQATNAKIRVRSRPSRIEPIAIVGRGVVLPGANDVEEFSRLLKSGETRLAAPSGIRWPGGVDSLNELVNLPHDAELRGGFVSDYSYDWQRHKIPPLQVARANPLQFMLLDAAAQAVEEAGYTHREFDRKSAGVVIGSVFGEEFGNQLLGGLRLPEFKEHLTELLAGFADGNQTREILEQFEQEFLKRYPALLDETGSFTSSTLASRVAKTLDFMGGALALDAGERSSFAAISTACRVLQFGHCHTVLCGVAQRAMDLSAYETLRLKGELSLQPGDGGIVPGEGVVVLMLKRLRDAERDGDPIRGVIGGVAPTVGKNSPVEAIEMTCSRAGIDREQVGRVVVDRPTRGRCVSGRLLNDALLEDCELQDRIGHLQAAHGLVQIVKETLDFESSRRKHPHLVGLLSSTRQGEAGALLLASCKIPLRKIPLNQQPLRNSRESLGLRSKATSMNEINGHDAVDASSSGWGPRLLRFGAESDRALVGLLERTLRGEIDASLGQPCFEPHHASRVGMVLEASTQFEAATASVISVLKERDAKSKLRKSIFLKTEDEADARIAFLFPGQGSQYADMFRDLAELPVARRTMHELDETLAEAGLPSCAETLWRAEDQLGQDLYRTQAAVLIADIIGVRVAQECGLTAFCMLGHSFGELAALWASGSVTLPQVIQVLQHRVDALEVTSGGPTGMVAVHEAAEDVRKRLREFPGLFISHENSRDVTVVAGTLDRLRTLRASLDREHVAVMDLDVPCAFHTPYLAPAAEEFERRLSDVTFLPPRVPLLSGVTHRFVADPEEIQQNLSAQLVTPVRFHQDLARLLAMGVDTFVEVGPRNVLTKLVRRNLGESSARMFALDEPGASLQRKQLSLQALAEVVQGGKSVSVVPVSTGETSRQTPIAKERLSTVTGFDATAKRRQARRKKIERLPDTSTKSDDTGSDHSGNDSRPNGTGPHTEIMPVSQPTHAVDFDQLRTFLIDFVIEHTGYPREVVQLDADLEADLGIDSIKKAQLFGELRELTGLTANGDAKGRSLADYRTLQDILNAVTGLTTVDSNGIDNVKPVVQTSEPRQATQAQAGVEADTLKEFVVDFVIEHTGYPREVVQLDADLEADLGIDSIKKAQLFGELRELTGLSANGSGKSLADFRTLQQIIDAASEQRDARIPTDAGQQPHQAETESGPSASEQDFQQSMPSRGINEPTFFDRGLLHGRERKTEVQNRLRTELKQPQRRRLISGSSAEELWSELSSDEQQELMGFARGANVHPTNLLKYTDEFLSSRIEPPIVPVRESRNAGVTSRYVLRTPELPQRITRPPSPRWFGQALIVGENEIGRALAGRLRQIGVEVATLVPQVDADASVREFESIWERGTIHHVFLVTPHDEAATTTLNSRVWKERRARGIATPFAICQRWMGLLQEHQLLDKASLVAVTNLGGAFGWTSPVVSAESGAMAGLCKAICIETWVNGGRTMPFKVVDAATHDDVRRTIDGIFAELAVPSHDLEMSWSGGKRKVVRAVPMPVDASDVSPIARGGTWILTGGARGVTAYVAKELGKRFDLKLHLVGTAPQPKIPAHWREMYRTRLPDLKAEIFRDAKARGVNTVKAWQDAEKAIEIDRTLYELKQLGVRASYHSCDVSDRRRLAELLDDVRRQDGPIEGIVHGAGIGRDASFDKKDPKRVDQCISAKVDGALALMALTRDDPVKYFVGFGSISGRFGANGHTDYSLANDMLAKLIGWYREQRPEVAATTFHWHAWDDVGMATRPETRLALEMINMRFMPAREAVEHLIRELEAGAPEAEVLITDERYHRVFNPVETREREVYRDVRPKPVANELPLLSRVGAKRSASGASKIELNPLSDPFLKEHRLDDRPLLPIAVGLELLAETARLANGGKSRFAFQDLTAHQALKFFDERSQFVSTRSTRRGEREVDVELLADVKTRDDKLVEKDRVYLSATAVEADTWELRERPTSNLPRRGWERVAYLPSGSKIYHGPSLQVLRQMCVEGDRGWGRISAPAISELAGTKQSVAGWMIPSACLDACLYATALLAGRVVRTAASLPVSIEYLAFGRMTTPGEACLVQLQFIKSEESHAWFDFSLFGDNGDAICVARNYMIAFLGGAQGIENGRSRFSRAEQGQPGRIANAVRS